jgi:NADPH-dependent curcumin reductase CurA
LKRAGEFGNVSAQLGSSELDNKQWVLARTPAEGWPVDDDFRWVETDAPSPGAGQMLTQTIYLSLDPYQWGRRRSGVEKPGDVCHGRTVSEVVESRLDGYAPGDIVFNTNGWQTYGLTGADVSNFGYMFPRKVDPGLAPVSTAIGILGMLGLTAYSGLVVQCQPQPGETVVVSAASGGVGQVACQLAKIYGCRVVGIAGAEHKVDFLLNEIGVDACVSHQSEDFAEELRAACPDGCDVYFENVGGAVYEAVLPLLRPNARITVCGMISQYGNTDGRNARDVWNALGEQTFAERNVTVHDLFVGNFVADYQDRFLAEMAAYVADKRVIYREDRWDGLENAPQAFRAMLAGGNFGKTIVVVGDDPTE